MLARAFNATPDAIIQTLGTLCSKDGVAYKFRIVVDVDGQLLESERSATMLANNLTYLQRMAEGYNIRIIAAVTNTLDRACRLSSLILCNAGASFVAETGITEGKLDYSRLPDEMRHFGWKAIPVFASKQPLAKKLRALHPKLYAVIEEKSEPCFTQQDKTRIITATPRDMLQRILTSYSTADAAKV